MEQLHNHSSAHWDTADVSGFSMPESRDIDLVASAALFEGEGRISLQSVELSEPSTDDLVVEVCWSGVSTGTERLLFTGEMPPFPGLSYPLVPGYEAVGRVIWSGDAQTQPGQYVFVPGSRGFKSAAGLFGAAASRLVVPATKAVAIDFTDPRDGVLLALAATARHALRGGAAPDLIVGHGVMGRLLARMTMALGHPPPNVWEIDPERADADGYAVFDPDCDGRNDYSAVYDVSGDATIIDSLIAHMRHGSELVLAGFYADRISFAFPRAFMKEARFRIAAEWLPEDLDDVLALHRAGNLSFDGLITHEHPANGAEDAYRTAFNDASCLKMVLDWRDFDGTAIR